jgi:hypothetical protein
VREREEPARGAPSTARPLAGLLSPVTCPLSPAVMDIRLTRGRNQRVWLWTACIVGVSALVMAAAMLFGDPTARQRGPGVGAAANFGSDRAPVLPVVIEPFERVGELTDRELGRLVHLTGTAESGVRRSALYVRTPQGRRILVRFEPAPPEGKLSGFFNGGGVDVTGYVQKISRAEFDVWMDTLQVAIPRPPPGVKFGDLPDSNFMRIDALFIKDYYLSVRPEGIGRRAAAPAAPVAPPQAPRPLPRPAQTAPPPPPAPPPPAEPAPEPADTVRP